MKFEVSMKNVKVGNITIGEVAVNTEYSVTEAVKLMNAGADIVVDIINKAPEIMEAIGKANIIEAKNRQEAKKISWWDDLYEHRHK